MIAVVGVGSMGAALVEGLLAADHPPEAMILVDRNQDKLDAFAGRGVMVGSDVAAVGAADWVIVAVKPYAMSATLGSLAAHLKPSATLISVAAGIDTAAIEAEFDRIAVVRAMPNTPALIGEAMTGVSPGLHVTPEQLQGACEILGAVGEVAVVPEDQLDALTAISGSGPAYLFYVAEALVEGAVTQGLPPELADRLVRQTLRGAALLFDASESDAAELRRRVTSKGGTTQAAVVVFDEADLKATFGAAVAAATNRSRELRGQS
ncbi:MAG: pyrroline-5-carboxylate reductase [Acidimicrobiia bacterium]|nr:pyrroline-5-carboxylate reductase [Acidimicrobiia bacterium]